MPLRCGINRDERKEGAEPLCRRNRPVDQASKPTTKHAVEWPRTDGYDDEDEKEGVEHGEERRGEGRNDPLQRPAGHIMMQMGSERQKGQKEGQKGGT